MSYFFIFVLSIILSYCFVVDFHSFTDATLFDLFFETEIRNFLASNTNCYINVCLNINQNMVRESCATILKTQYDKARKAMHIIFFRLAHLLYCHFLSITVAFCGKPSPTRARTFIPEQQWTTGIIDFRLAI